MRPSRATRQGPRLFAEGPAVAVAKGLRDRGLNLTMTMLYSWTGACCGGGPCATRRSVQGDDHRVEGHNNTMKSPWSWLAGLVGRRSPPSVSSRILGVVTRVSPVTWYAGVTRSDGREEVEVSICGNRSSPDPGILAAAELFWSDFARMESDLRAFLAAEAAHRSECAAELSQLRIVGFSFMHPAEPGLASIFLGTLNVAGPASERVWSCDWVCGRFQGLGCDT